MTKQEKIASLENAMTQGTRGAAKDGQLVAGGEQFYHFTDTAPKELVALFLEHYAVQDLDYETFSVACDIVSDIYDTYGKDTDDEATERIYEQASDSASIYTSDRLSYLNNNNEYEIAEIAQEYATDSISSACAIWYDKQVEQAAIIIKDWINA